MERRRRAVGNFLSELSTRGHHDLVRSGKTESGLLWLRPSTSSTGSHLRPEAHCLQCTNTPLSASGWTQNAEQSAPTAAGANSAGAKNSSVATKLGLLGLSAGTGPRPGHGRARAASSFESMSHPSKSAQQPSNRRQHLYKGSSATVTGHRRVPCCTCCHAASAAAAHACLQVQAQGQWLATRLRQCWCCCPVRDW